MIEWKGDNEFQVEQLLGAHVVRMDRERKNLRIIGLGGVEFLLTPGDWLMLDGDRLGRLEAEPGDWLAPPTH